MSRVLGDAIGPEPKWGRRSLCSATVSAVGLRVTGHDGERVPEGTIAPAT